jgi:hypothetical protein
MLKIGSILVIGERLLSVRKWVNSARLVRNPETIERTLIALAEAQTPFKPKSGKIKPSYLRGEFNHAVWSGSTPAHLLPLLARMRMSPATEAISTVLWMLCCSACPPLTRRLGRVRVSWRNFSARGLFKSGHVYRWLPGRPAIDLGALQQEAEPSSLADVHSAG